MIAKEATSNTPASSSNKSPNRAIDLKTSSTWSYTENVVQEKTLDIDLDGEFNIVMLYVVGKNLRQFKLELGKFCSLLKNAQSEVTQPIWRAGNIPMSL